MSDATNRYRRNDTLRKLDDAAELLEELEPGDLDDDRVRAALDTVQDHVSQLIWARTHGRPEFRP